MSGQHAIFAPSSLDVIVHCHGMLSMIADLPPEEDSENAREGTAAHWAAEKILQSDVLITESEIAPNGVMVTEEMLDGAQVYFDDVDRITAVSLKPPVTIEQRVYMPQIHAECWGTPDSWWFDLRNGILYVWDYKFGHRRVDPIGLYQLVAYIVGIMHELAGTIHDLHDADLGKTRIVATIVQPRCYDGKGPINRWNLLYEDLRPYVNRLQYACEQSSLGGPCTPGPHCGDCRAQHRCDANLAMVSRDVDYSTSAIPRDLSPIGIVYEDKVLEAALDRIKKRKEALDAEIESRLRNGELLPGKALEPAYGKRKWMVDNDVVYGMGDMLGVNFRNELPVSPAVADGLLKKASQDLSVIKDLYGRPQNGMKVADDDGSRARRIFGKGEI